MSALLNHNNEITTPLIRWKGTVYRQSSSLLQRTRDTNENTSGSILFKARPLKRIYRRETATQNARGNPRISASLYLANTPGGSSLVPSTDLRCYDNAKYFLDAKSVEPTVTQCSSASCMSAQQDARRRVRSSGMIKRQFQLSSPDHPDPVYFTDNRQYLSSRNRTWQQNNFAFLRKGDPSLTPGTNLSKTNVYAPQGINHCPLVQVNASTNNNFFSYTWLDGESYDVSIPDGYYNLASFANEFQRIMYDYGHYYTAVATDTPMFLLNISHNTLYDMVELTAIPRDNFPEPDYIAPEGSLSLHTPYFEFPNTNIQTILGFSAGEYPNPAVSGPQITQIFTAKGTLQMPYVSLHYKPSNPQFAHQGGVSSSAHIARKRYNEITGQGLNNRTALGPAFANALAYSVPTPGYTLKDKMGYPNPNTPKFPFTTPETFLTCENTHIR